MPKTERQEAMKRDLASWQEVRSYLQRFEREGEDYARVEIYGSPHNPTIQPVTGG